MSAITIPDMISIVKQHGLVPVPMDLDLETLAPSPQALEKALSSRTRVVVVAHLFGAVIPIKPLVEFAKAHQLFLIEDCAQSFCGWQAMEDTGADASMYSFGPIKTATCLGGALLRVRDPDTMNRIRSLHSQYSQQSRRAFIQRIAKYALLKLASMRFFYGKIHKVIALLGYDPDQVINSLAKNFGKGEFLVRIRQQPCDVLIALLERRTKTFRCSRIQHRADLGCELAKQLKDFVRLPGLESSYHSYWVFPILVDANTALIPFLRKRGFDATFKHNLTVLDAPQDGSARDAPQMEHLLSQVAFLPIYPELKTKAIEELIALIRCYHAATCCTVSPPSDEQNSTPLANGHKIAH
jgi:dTDP-4-amino-4,6-dideoxygalactose transaminase